MNIFKEIFNLIGICTVVVIMSLTIELTCSKIKYWREHKTKIKCLCKPHVYEVCWIWNNSEIELRCKKCGKTKRVHIDKKSFEEWFGKKSKDVGSI